MHTLRRVVSQCGSCRKIELSNCNCISAHMMRHPLQNFLHYHSSIDHSWPPHYCTWCQICSYKWDFNINVGHSVDLQGNEADMTRLCVVVHCAGEQWDLHNQKGEGECMKQIVHTHISLSCTCQNCQNPKSGCDCWLISFAGSAEGVKQSTAFLSKSSKAS